MSVSNAETNHFDAAPISLEEKIYVAPAPTHIHCMAKFKNLYLINTAPTPANKLCGSGFATLVSVNGFMNYSNCAIKHNLFCHYAVEQFQLSLLLHYIIILSS
jgi:hypothetical protein